MWASQRPSELTKSATKKKKWREEKLMWTIFNVFSACFAIEKYKQDVVRCTLWAQESITNHLLLFLPSPRSFFYTRTRFFFSRFILHQKIFCVIFRRHFTFHIRERINNQLRKGRREINQKVIIYLWKFSVEELDNFRICCCFFCWESHSRLRVNVWTRDTFDPSIELKLPVEIHEIFKFFFESSQWRH